MAARLIRTVRKLASSGEVVFTSVQDKIGDQLIEAFQEDSMLRRVICR